MTHDSTDHYQEVYSKTVLGFWIYLLTDFVLFGTFFATYAVLHNSTFGGPSSRDLLRLPFLTYQTLVFLCCAFFAGLGGAAAHRKDKKLTLTFFIVTLLLGCVFVGMECADFYRLLHAGNSWKNSAFLSMFFTLLAMHGVHVLFALGWIIVLLVPVYFEGVTPVSLRRLTCLKMFWQFLNIIWIFIYGFLSI